MATKTGSKKTADDESATGETTEKVQDLLDTMNKTSHSAIDAMHRFADSINDTFPDVGEEGEGPRSKIIAAAFKMTGEIVDAGHRMASSVLDAGSEALAGMARPAGAQAG